MPENFLTPDLSDFQCILDGGTTVLSALRLWEHGVLGQVNVTDSPISRRFWASQVLRHIDVIQYVDGVGTIVCTLQDIEDKECKSLSAGSESKITPYPSEILKAGRWRKHAKVLVLKENVERFLYHLSHRVAERGAHGSFWPTRKDASSRLGVLGLAGFYSKLIVFLEEKCVGRHAADSWLEILASGQRQGIKQEELLLSGLPTWLAQQRTIEPDRRYSANDLRKRISWSNIRLSVMPVVHFSETPITLERHLQSESYLSKKLAPVRDNSKPQLGQRRFLHEYDRALGYRVEGIEHETLWGREVHWQAVTYRGQPIKNQRGACLLSKPEVAHQLAMHHAQRMMPKREPTEVWRDYSLAGGENYREWLVTLPWYPVTYTKSHFDFRNVLIHIRCNERVDQQGQRILFLQEIQSDWAQDWAQWQREQKTNKTNEVGIPQPPFSKEWPALAVKLMLLHAVAWQFDAVAWMTGAMQVDQFGREHSWFKTLYDEILPKSVLQALSVHGGALVELEISDSSQEHTVMGVLLDEELRSSLSHRGLPVWG